MLSDLPEPHHAPLPQAPVELVVWQLQFAEPADVVPPAVGTALAERLAEDSKGDFQLERLVAQTFAISLAAPGPPGVQHTEPAQVEGWTLRRGPVVVTVSRHFLSIETNIFETWPSFRAVVQRALEALGDIVSLPGEQRLGLRYVDRIVRPGVQSLGDWTDLLAPWLIGPLAHPQLHDAVAAYAQQIDFDSQAEGIRATLRQRAFADAEQKRRQTVILDFDVFRQGYRPVENDATLATTDQMNDIAHRLFEASITDRLYDTFGADQDEK